MLSEYQLKIIVGKEFSFWKSKRVISSLGNKRKHKLHYQNLKLCLNLILKLKNVHSTLSLKHKLFSNPYIGGNTVLQRGAKEKGEKLKIKS